MIPNIILAGVMLVALILYALLGGADFGAGFWDLLCRGPRRDNQRRLIAEAIHPVWETNHVWLIFLIVVMFSGFPPAFSSIAIGLAVPMFLILLGIVLRGASYVFRAYSEGDERMQLHWGRIFSISSSITPLFLGIVIGAISCDATFVKDPNQNGLLRTWYQPFPLLVGVLSSIAKFHRRQKMPALSTSHHEQQVLLLPVRGLPSRAVHNGYHKRLCSTRMKPVKRPEQRPVDCLRAVVESLQIELDYQSRVDLAHLQKSDSDPSSRFVLVAA